MRETKLQIDRSGKRLFTKIYYRNAWGGRESRSGRGSDLKSASRLIIALPKLFRELGIESLLDLPCGDFNWMRYVDLGSIHYAGGDIVAKLVRENERKYGGETRRFAMLDVVSDALPKVDLIFCRDCLVHLSHGDALRAIANILESDATWLLTTSYSKRTRNKDIRTGRWRPINLLVEPFSFPKPIHTIEEGCDELFGLYADKALCLWKLDALRSSFPRSSAGPRE